MKQAAITIILILSAAIVLAACGSSDDSIETSPPSDLQSFQPSPTPTPTPTTTPTPTPTTTPTPTPISEPLSAADIFKNISTSVAYIDTPAGSGSGILIDDSYIVTNAHVVWPFEEVRVVFPDGSEYVDSPVVNWDLMGDLAIIGPIETSIQSLQFTNNEEIDIGSNVFLVGYPGEDEEFPQPTISRGIISRLRECELVDITFLQTDAAVSGGQSGGVLVSEYGEVLGISCFYFTDAFALVSSAADIQTRIDGLAAGEDVDGLGDRHIPLAGGLTEQEAIFSNVWDDQVFIVNEPKGTFINIEATSQKDITFCLSDLYGDCLILEDEGVSGKESGSATTRLDAPHFLLIGMAEGDGTGYAEINCNYDLIPFNDKDDGISIAIGDTILGNMDYPNDSDYFMIDLMKDDLIEITVDSLSIDSYVLVVYIDAREDDLVEDDDSGGGIFDLNSKIIYRAPFSQSYLIVVQDATGMEIGGYSLSIAEAPAGSIETKPESKPAPAQVDSPYGLMSIYESSHYPFTIHYPSEWTETSFDTALISAYFESEDGERLVIAEENLVDMGFLEMSLTEYVDIVVSTQESLVPGYEVISREKITTSQDLSAEVFEFSAYNGLFKGRRLVYLQDNKVGFNATYMVQESAYDELLPMFSYIISSFEVDNL